VLDLLQVQISAAIGLAATTFGFSLGVARHRRPGGKVQVVASGNPMAGTQAVWIVGSLMALFWAAGFFLLPEYAYHWPGVPDFPFSWIVQLTGVGLGITGGLLYSRSARALGTMMTPTIRIQEDHQFVRSGPYRFIRHPIYSAILLIAMGQALLFLSPIAALLTVVLGILAIYRSGLEEKLMSSPKGFGRAYREYASTTGRFLPRMTQAR
jgi:protein-S-isoprenylcysteine O-methyltransferase Ste14